MSIFIKLIIQTVESNIKTRKEIQQVIHLSLYLSFSIMYFKKSFFGTLFILTTFTSLHLALYVKNIQDCPALTPRKPPSSVHDLRIDDIKVIGALGDRYSFTSNT